MNQLVKPEEHVEEALKGKSVEEIVETLNKGEGLKNKARDQRFQEMYQAYKIDNKKLSQAIEYGGGFGMMGLSVIYMVIKKTKKVL